MKAAVGRVACAPGRWLWKKCLNAAMMILVLVASLVAGTMLSAVLFRAVEL